MSSFRCDGQNIDDARARRHPRREMLDQEKWRGYVHADGLLPFLARDFGKWFYHRDAGIIHQEINRLMPDLGDQVIDAAAGASDEVTFHLLGAILHSGSQTEYAFSVAVLYLFH